MGVKNDFAAQSKLLCTSFSQVRSAQISHYSPAAMARRQKRSGSWLSSLPVVVLLQHHKLPQSRCFSVHDFPSAELQGVNRGRINQRWPIANGDLDFNFLLCNLVDRPPKLH